MARRYIPLGVRCMLWGRAAGRCEFRTCNEIIHRHPETKETVNLADVSHIIGFSKDGPRGEDELSEELAKDIENLMLLCKTCHETIDTNRSNYPVGLLKKMKQHHEERVEMLTEVTPERGSHMLLYCANVGENSAKVSYQSAAAAMLPERFPAQKPPVALGLVNSAVKDHDEGFWKIEQVQLQKKFNTDFLPRYNEGEFNHVSVFAIAPQPLLMLLGCLLSDVTHADVFQLHREPTTWHWLSDDSELEVEVQEPAAITGEPALVIALSATVTDDRVLAVRDDASIWRITIASPNNDFLRSRDQLAVLRHEFRSLMDRIKACHGEDVRLHVFPAMPVAAAVEFGRVIMPKADLQIAVYDQQRDNGGFVYALTLPCE